MLPRALTEGEILSFVAPVRPTGTRNSFVVSRLQSSLSSGATSRNGISTRYESGVLSLPICWSRCVVRSALGGASSESFVPSQFAFASAKPSPRGTMQIAFLRSSSGTNSTGGVLR